MQVWSTSGGPQGRHTMQFWGGNLRSYQRDLQYCHYHWFHKCGHRLLPTLRHCKPWFCHFCSKSKNSNVVCNFDVWYIFWFIWPYFRQFTPTLRSSTKGGGGSSNSSNSGNETVPYLAHPRCLPATLSQCNNNSVLSLLMQNAILRVQSKDESHDRHRKGFCCT